MRLLIVSSRFPYPLEKGDKLRLFQQIRYLSAHHELYLFAVCSAEPAKEHLEKLNKYCKRVEWARLPKWLRVLKLFSVWFSPVPFQVAYFYDKGIKRRIRKILFDEDIDHIYCQLIRMSEYVRTFPLPKTIDYMDALGEGLHRRYLNSNNMLKKWVFNKEAHRVRRYEFQVWKYFDQHLIISERDREDLGFDSDMKVEVIPNGVDLEYFTPKSDRKPVHDIVFTGNMGYGPNIEAAKLLVGWTRDLEFEGKPVSILIAGARPDSKVLRLADMRVDVRGWVDDIREAYNAGTIFAAPIFTGSGLQNKILEAMAMGIPCITTSMVNQSILAPEGAVIRVADTRELFRQEVLTLLGNRKLRMELSNNGRGYVADNFSWERFNAQLNDLIMKPVPKHGYSTFKGRNE